ncbi:probable isoprenylcysteine alpha-carbonyl methylesterase ICMEL2 [Dioscorea cayenensis subsp. rotundata]|uniref:Probable isoprenylcysteine alpha-carbonyl methylesterase ICMEL2 n=1 Tax=Dioscorea cayennensis subsp. rotundata TaxID=55577 RepID=A0AB40ALQ8_DIOCR|nr:probable isoprenylcysteine alpha-carbonyl methylesterase ICMEL2 [Dioscorea cayenensis subsp. rotundata]
MWSTPSFFYSFIVVAAARIYLVGQSAGAHIAACTLLDQTLKESGEGENATWSVSQIKAYFGISGGYNLLKLVDHFHSRGLYRSIFLSVMEGEESLRRYSPEVVVQDPHVRHAASLLPPIILFHGTAIILYLVMPEALTLNAGVETKLVLYRKTHAAIFLSGRWLLFSAVAVLQLSSLSIFLLIRCNHGNEINSVSLLVFLNLPCCHICTGLPGLGSNILVESKSVRKEVYKHELKVDMFWLEDPPLRGGKDELLEDIISVIHAGDTVALAEDAVACPTRRLIPEFMIQ